MHQVLRIAAGFALLLGLPILSSAGAQTVPPEQHDGGILFIVRDKSGLATGGSPIFLASNHAAWSPGDESMRLAGRSDLRWQILLPGPVGPPRLQFKFTRGSWETVEVAADLSDVPNRTLAPVPAELVRAGEPIVVELEIERFADERAVARPDSGAAGGPPEAATAHITGVVRRVQVVGGAGAAAGAMRDVLVWLPPGYDDPANADRRYPVLYMQDGQNVFDHRPPTPAEWAADETATSLIAEGRIEPVIIAAIPNSGRNRTIEYLPADAMGVQGEGDAYIDWLVREVVPRVERAFRADPNPAKRGIGGSSLGGLIALRAAQRHPDVFGRVLAESAAIRLPDADLADSVFADLAGYRAQTFLGMGGKEWGEGEPERNAAWVEAAQSLAPRIAQALVAAGGDTHVMLNIGPDAAHSEHAWSQRLPTALQYLYPARDQPRLGSPSSLILQPSSFILTPAATSSTPRRTRPRSPPSRWAARTC